MTNRLSRIAVLLTASALMLGGCGEDSDDSFAAEYESLNGQAGRGGAHPEVDIADDHRFHPASEGEVRELLEGGDGAIYFGFPECPWCRNAVGAMDEAAKAVDLDQIHYVNVAEMRDQRDVRGEIDEEGSDFYTFLLDELGEFAPEHPQVEGERRILVPLVAVVLDGEVVSSHLGTVPSQTDPSIPMTDAQQAELVDIYSEQFSQIPG